MPSPRPLTLLALLGLLLGGSLVAPPRPAAAQGAACFAETGFCIRDRFLAYWQANGGLARNGFPLSEERRELLEDGVEYTVQYFERVRLELHPENAAPHDVLLGQFGRRVLRTGDIFGAFDTAPAAPRSDTAYFPETGHNLGERFLAYWRANGGLAQFGYPLTEEGRGQLVEDGREYLVQYFERARFEYHPENVGTPYEVLLGQFGRRILADADLLAGERGFALLYLGTERVQQSLGRPTAAAARAPGAYQGFERGAMVWQGDTRIILVLCGGTPQAGDRVLGFNDTWAEGDPAGGGPGPQAGLYEPRRGFGKVWRENAEVRDCLGYATTPDETGYTIATQPFARPTAPQLGGQLISATTPEGRFIYVLFGAAQRRTAYERYPDPLR